jgi:UDP-glucose 4-epimerase
MDLKDRKVLVTGGAGFIGSHLIDELVDKKANVIIVDNLSTGLIDNVNPKAKFYEIDILSKGIEKLFSAEKPEFVYHFASNTNVPKSIAEPLYDFQSLIGAMNILENCRNKNVARLIFTSSGFIYGNTAKRPINEKEPYRPISPYAITKKTIESYLEFYKKIFDLSYVVLRLATVYGPRQRTGAIADYIRQLSQNKQAEFFGSGLKTRDYIFVEDVVDVLIKTLDIPLDFEDPCFNIGTGIETTLDELYSMIADYLKKDPHPIYRPERPGELFGYSLDFSKAKEIMQWEPRHSLVHGLEKTLSWWGFVK